MGSNRLGQRGAGSGGPSAASQGRDAEFPVREASIRLQSRRDLTSSANCFDETAVGFHLMGSNAQIEFRRHEVSVACRSQTIMPNICPTACADDIALIRSMHTEAFNHHPGQLMMNSGVPTFGRPSMGSWINYGLGSVSENLPGYVVLTAGRGTSGGASNWSSGFLPSSYEGVLFRNQGDPVLHLSNPEGLPHQCQRRSLQALKELNEEHYAQTRDPEILSRIASYELAYRMQSAAPELIDLSREDERTLEMYGVNRGDGDVEKGRGFSPGVFATYGRNCLLARRLVERGVRFVNVYHASWDHHSSLDDQLPVNCQIADQPVAALLKDLKQRGLLDETLVVWAGEFGRTPLAENNGGPEEINTGRDHHPFAFSIFMAGGGIKGGQVIGRTDEIGWGVEEDPVSINDLHATILHLFGIDHLRLTHRFQGATFGSLTWAARSSPNCWLDCWPCPAPPASAGVLMFLSVQELLNDHAANVRQSEVSSHVTVGQTRVIQVILIYHET